MRALQYERIGSEPVVVDVPTPEPGPGEVLLRVTAGGVCHSDEFVMSLPADEYDAYGFGLPLTLGHEGAGVVEAVGDGVEGVEVDQPYAVYGPWGCGRCHVCAHGAENYCPYAAQLGIQPPGLGAPGSMAEYLIVDDARHLVPLGDLDPVEHVPLTDAGLTPYHSIKHALPSLTAGSTAVVIGVGGLGHVGVQILTATSAATVVALDVRDEQLDLARRLGADHALRSDEDAAAGVREITGASGAAAVFDFVGAQPTVELAGAVVAMDGMIEVVGLGGGALPVGIGTVPYGVAVRAPYWGTRDELIEVLDLARAGRVSVEVERFALEDAPQAYRRLHEGSLRGRAVVVPGG